MFTNKNDWWQRPIISDDNLFSEKMEDLPKRPEEETLLCVSIETYLNTGNFYAVRSAVPCDGKVECKDGIDEIACKSPFWLLPVILLVAIFLLCCSQFAFFYKYIREEIDKISGSLHSKCQLPLQNVQCKSQKHIYIAMLLEEGAVEDIKIMMKNEIEAHTNEGKALCCFKVTIISVRL